MTDSDSILAPSGKRLGFQLRDRELTASRRLAVCAAAGFADRRGRELFGDLAVGRVDESDDPSAPATATVLPSGEIATANRPALLHGRLRQLLDRLLRDTRRVCFDFGFRSFIGCASRRIFFMASGSEVSSA
jgi:hypothetical protein